MIIHEKGRLRECKLLDTFDMNEYDWNDGRNRELEIRRKVALAQMEYQEEVKRRIDRNWFSRLFYELNMSLRKDNWSPELGLSNDLGNPKNVEGAREHFYHVLFKREDAYRLSISEEPIQEDIQCDSEDYVEAQNVKTKIIEGRLVGNKGFKNLLENACLAADKKSMPYVRIIPETLDTYVSRANIGAEKIPYTGLLIHFFKDHGKDRFTE